MIEAILIGLGIIACLGAFGAWLDHMNKPLRLTPEQKWQVWLDTPLPELEPQTNWDLFEKKIEDQLRAHDDPWVNISPVFQSQFIHRSQPQKCERCGNSDYEIAADGKCGKCAQTIKYEIEQAKRKQRDSPFSDSRSRGIWQIPANVTPVFADQHEYPVAMIAEGGVEEILVPPGVDPESVYDKVDRWRRCGLSREEIRQMLLDDYQLADKRRRAAMIEAHKREAARSPFKMPFMDDGMV